MVSGGMDGVRRLARTGIHSRTGKQLRGNGSRDGRHTLLGDDTGGLGGVLVCDAVGKVLWNEHARQDERGDGRDGKGEEERR